MLLAVPALTAQWREVVTAAALAVVAARLQPQWVIREAASPAPLPAAAPPPAGHRRSVRIRQVGQIRNPKRRLQARRARSRRRTRADRRKKRSQAARGQGQVRWPPKSARSLPGRL